MKARNLTLSALGIVALGIIAVAPIQQAYAQHSAPKITKWEYKLVSITSGDTDALVNKGLINLNKLTDLDANDLTIQIRLNEMGKDGWQLIEGRSLGDKFIFQRPLP